MVKGEEGMKVRSGFVSNSSSSSFCLGKAYMTPEQVTLFSDWLGKHNKDFEEGYVFQTGHYFFGTIDQSEEAMFEFLDSIGIDEQYVDTAM